MQTILKSSRFEIPFIDPVATVKMPASTYDHLFREIFENLNHTVHFQVFDDYLEIEGHCADFSISCCASKYDPSNIDVQCKEGKRVDAFYCLETLRKYKFNECDIIELKFFMIKGDYILNVYFKKCEHVCVNYHLIPYM